MAAPNTLYIPIIAERMSAAVFLEVMRFLSDDLGLIDYIPDSSAGGDYVHLPKYGKISSGFDRLDVTGTITTGQSAKTSTMKDQIAVVRHKGLLFEYYASNADRAGITSEEFSAEIGRQIAIEAAKSLIVDCYNASIAAADNCSGDHDHDPYVDTGTAGSQVDMTADVIQSAKYLLGDLMDTLDIAVDHSKQWNDLTQSSISTAYNVPNIMGDVYRNGQFRQILGTTFITDDQIPTAAGPTTGSPTKYQALFFRSRKNHPEGLAPLVVSFQRPLTIYTQHVLGQQSVKFQRQPELAYAVGVRGMTWDVSSGGANPTDGAFATATNWDDAYSHHKELGIVLLRSN